MVKVLYDIHDQHTKRAPIVLTIGFFDGMHLGHQELFSKVRELRGEEGMVYTLTFVNHPKSFFKPDSPLPLITTLNQRVIQIKEQGCDTLFLLEFDEEIKNQSADEFLSSLYEHITFDHLVLGPNATIGHNREGNVDLIQLLAKKFSFDFHLVPYTQIEGQTISSTRIRDLIKKGSLQEAEKMLGRPYSIQSEVVEGLQLGRDIGFPTLNVDVEGLELPPLGVYKVHVLAEGQKYLGAANLGWAPTLQDRKTPVLEVHLLNFQGSIDAESVEVVFLDFIREEKKFSSLDELKKQIDLDIETILS